MVGMRRTHIARALLGMAVAATVIAPSAADPLVLEEGRALAGAWCSRCHVIGDDPQRGALADAPSFSSLAERDDLDEDALANALLRPHPVMPTFPLTSADLEALAAYIRSLGPRAVAPSDDARATARPSGAVAGRPSP